MASKPQAILYRMVMPDHVCPYGLKALHLLRAQGYAVLEAEHSLDALELAIHHAAAPIGLLLTDMVLPHMSGHDLAKRLQDRFPDTRILFTSGYAETPVTSNERLDRNVAFIQKPFTAAALTRKVRQVLDG